MQGEVDETATTIEGEDDTVDSKIPTLNEEKNAITTRKYQRAAGLDNLPSSVFKVDKKISARRLLPILKPVWKTEKLHSDCNNGLLIKLSK